MSRTLSNFNKDWRFFLGDPADAKEPHFDDATWRSLDLPHDWSMDYPVAADNPTGGGGGYVVAGIGWYRKTFRIPESAQGKRVFLQFDGVFMNASVYVNGQHVGSRDYGYSAFEVDITDAIKTGENVVAVRVDNSAQPNSRYFTGSGIYRDVCLLVTEPVHLAQWGVFCATNGLYRDNTIARLNLKTRVLNESDNIVLIKVIHELFDIEGMLCMTDASALQIPAHGEAENEICPSVEQPHLWTVDDPYLYTLKTTIEMDGEATDVVETRVGIRTAVFDCDKGFLLNGKQVKIKGMAVHHDCGLTGAVGYRESWVRRLSKLKDMGCNGIRTAHNPASEVLMNLCDEFGFLVMDEAFDEWLITKIKKDADKFPYGYGQIFAANSDLDLTTLVRRDRNHPSVILWSIGNEIREQSTIRGVEILKHLQDICHREDPFRCVTLACDNVQSVAPDVALREFENALDVVGYNYVGRWRERAETFYDEDRHLYPKRRMVGSENPSAGGIRGNYDLEMTFPMRATYTRATMRHEALWRYTVSRDFVAGDYLWTGVDYLGETTWPCKGATAGAIDAAGFPKDTFYYFRSIWNTKDVTLHILPHWNWPGREGEFVPVIAYTNCEEVSLFLNGRLVGTKGYDCPNVGALEAYNKPAKPTRPTTHDLHLSWDVPYEPGEIKAVGRIGGKVVMEQVIRTTGAPVAIKAEADCRKLKVDGIAHIDISTLDATGLHVPNADNLISVKVSGAGRLVGMDNGSVKDLTMYSTPARQLFAGWVMAMVMATGKGPIEVEISSEGMKPVKLTLQAE